MFGRLDQRLFQCLASGQSNRLFLCRPRRFDREHRCPPCPIIYLRVEAENDNRPGASPLYRPGAGEFRPQLWFRVHGCVHDYRLLAASACRIATLVGLGSRSRLRAFGYRSARLSTSSEPGMARIRPSAAPDHESARYGRGVLSLCHTNCVDNAIARQ